MTKCTILFCDYIWTRPNIEAIYPAGMKELIFDFSHAQGMQDEWIDRAENAENI